MPCKSVHGGDILFKSYKKKASATTVVIRCFTEQCQELGHGQLRGTSYCMCFYKGEKKKKKQQDHSAHSFRG